MELPINVIIIFFVALVVGGGIVYFASHQLSGSQQQINDLRDDPAYKDNIVEVGTATETTIVGLANECVRKGKSTSIGSKSICFAVFASSWPDFASLNGRQLDQEYTLDTRGVPANPSAVRVTFDPLGNVTVTG
jgi:HAMP domain-containing protein